MAKAKKPIPFQRQGDFCIVGYNRDTEVFELLVDTGTQKPDSYIFRSIEELYGLLVPERFWNLGRSGDELIHMAKEFGLAQIAFDNMMPHPVITRDAIPKVTVDSEDEPLGFFHLPRLWSNK